MKAVVQEEYGPPEVLHQAEVATPTPGSGELQIKVAAAGVNPADCKWRGGLLRQFRELEFPAVLGYDVAGTVSETGPSVTGFAPGDRVVAMLDHGIRAGYAEYAVAAQAACVRVPDDMDLALAAAIPTPGLTGLQLVAQFIAPVAGDRLLVTGACGSVGRFAVHAARERGAHVVAAVRPEQCDTARSLGADEVIVLEETYVGAPFDHVADTVGGPAVAALCAHVRADGRIRTVATDPIDPVGLPSQPEFVALHMDAVQLSALVAAVHGGLIDYSVARRVSLGSAAEAHRLMERGGLSGKIVLMP